VAAAVHDPTALTRLPGGLALGTRHGAIHLGGESLLHDTPASAVTALLAGPSGTIAAGFSDGTVGLWDTASGARLIVRRLHGAVQDLALFGDTLHALTELGAHTAFDLGIYRLDRCDVLARVRERVPVCWEGGQAVPCEAGGESACAGPTRPGGG
jgi:hypothetical protein